MLGIIRNIAIVVTLILFVVSSVGIALSRHICYKEGTINLSLTGHSICQEHQQKQCAMQGCCKNILQTTRQNKRCCDDDVVYAILDIVKKHEEPYSYCVELFIGVVQSFPHGNHLANAPALTAHLHRLLFLPSVLTGNQVLSLLRTFRL